ncbi:MAG: cohesin domain-containing protein [bacterium]|nr:cohesin domain-containing protein [bacterium]
MRSLAGLLCALTLSACSMGAGTPQKGTARVALNLTTETGSQLATVTLNAANAAELHQLACRVEYNPQVLRFTGAQRGELVTASAVFFSTDKGAGYVPVAFTYHAGEKTPTNSGSVATLSFEVLDSNADTGVRLVSDEDYLIARDSIKRSIPVIISGVAR